ncbi:rhodanese-like domain-containing protein [Sulfurimonas sp. HSL-1716]|uniref:sulfurtransferase n=1 Tax=Hydrocurvibacter sulfurireducens TaxID=3131937 RepID=UPI0031F8532E
MKFITAILLFSLTLFASGGFISVDELQKKIDDKNLIIIDVTDHATYKKGHIKNAVLADVTKFINQTGSYRVMKPSAEIQKLARGLGINNDSQIVIYGHGNKKELLKESYLALCLIVNGAKDISILDGGYLSWTFESNLLSSTQNVTNKEGNFTAVYNPNIVVGLDYVKNNISKIPMLDARSTEFYYGTAIPEGVKRAGHIKNAMSSFWKDKFLKDETLRSDEELKEMFLTGYDLHAEDEVVSYCTSGLEASMNWYILYNHLGLKNAKIYDASMREWGNRDDTPMVRFKWEVLK